MVDAPGNLHFYLLIKFKNHVLFLINTVLETTFVQGRLSCATFSHPSPFQKPLKAAHYPRRSCRASRYLLKNYPWSIDVKLKWNYWNCRRFKQLLYLESRLNYSKTFCTLEKNVASKEKLNYRLSLINRMLTTRARFAISARKIETRIEIISTGRKSRTRRTFKLSGFRRNRFHEVIEFSTSGN